MSTTKICPFTIPKKVIYSIERKTPAYNGSLGIIICLQLLKYGLNSNSKTASYVLLFVLTKVNKCTNFLKENRQVFSNL